LASTGEPYIGYYYKISNGSAFSGKSPNNSLTELLISPTFPSPPTSSNLIFSNVLLSDYTDLKPPFNLTYLIPVYNPTLPTEEDYKLGKFTRCFCKKSNEFIYIEINKETYLNLIKQNSEYLWQLYLPFEIPWQISQTNKEQIYNTNKNVTELISQRFNLFKFGDYLKHDYLKYYK